MKCFNLGTAMSLLLAGLLCTGCGANEQKGDLAALQLQPEQDYKIEYVYFVGLPNRFERHEAMVRAADLTEGERRKVRDLVNSARVLVAPEKEFGMTEGGPVQKVTVNTGCVSRSVQWTYKHAPSSVWPLVDYLESKSTTEKKGLP